ALHRRRGRPVVVAALGAVVVLLVAATWYATRGGGVGRVREFASYVWQFYLPRLGFMSPAPGSGWNVRDVFVDRFYGTFAGLEVGFSSAVYTVLAVASLLLVALALAGLWARREVVRAQ